METDETADSAETPNLKCELNTLSRADGSCILCYDETVMAAAMYGPVEVKQHKLLIDRATLEVIFKPECGQSQIGDRLYESIISKICAAAIITTFYPRTAIYVIIQEMQKSKNMLACSINATCLALIHAGIAMNYLFAAVTTVVRSDDGTDANLQSSQAEPSITFVFENTSDKILAVDSCGKITEAEYRKCLKKCQQTSVVIFQFYKDMISKYALKM